MDANDLPAQGTALIEQFDKLVWACWARDAGNALPLARDLRSRLDVLIRRLTLASIKSASGQNDHKQKFSSGHADHLKNQSAQSEHFVSPLAKAIDDLARIVAAKAEGGGK